MSILQHHFHISVHELRDLPRLGVVQVDNPFVIGATSRSSLKRIPTGGN